MGLLLGAATPFVSTSTTGDPVHAIADLQGREPLVQLQRDLEQDGCSFGSAVSIVHREILLHRNHKTQKRANGKKLRKEKKSKGTNGMYRPEAREEKVIVSSLSRAFGRVPGQNRTK